jgi:hypothetical protein
MTKSEAQVWMRVRHFVALGGVWDEQVFVGCTYTILESQDQLSSCIEA